MCPAQHQPIYVPVTPAIAAAMELAHWLRETLAGSVSVGPSLRQHSAGACYWIAVDHHAAAVALIERDFPAAACVLIRVQLESWLAGLWLQHCATEKQVLRICNGADTPSAKQMITQLEAIAGFVDGKLSGMHEANWKTLCSYVHTGGLQIQRWQTDNSIEPNYQQEEIEEVLTNMADIALMAGISLALLAGSTELVSRLLTRRREIEERG